MARIKTAITLIEERVRRQQGPWYQGVLTGKQTRAWVENAMMTQHRIFLTQRHLDSCCASLVQPHVEQKVHGVTP